LRRDNAMKPNIIKNKFLLTSTVILSIVFLFNACESPSEVSLSHFDEEKAYFEFVMTNDDFFISEEDVLNDEENDFTVDNGEGEEFIAVNRIARRILDVERSFTHEFVNDTVAIVTMERTLQVRLYIGGLLEDDGRGYHYNAVVSKDFEEKSTRKAKFLKVNNTRSAEDDWKMVEVSLLEGGTADRSFDIDHFMMAFREGRSFEYDDPLDTFMRISLGTREVPVVTLAHFQNQGFKIEITIESENENPEVLYLRHGGGLEGIHGHRNMAGYMHRTQIPLDTEEYSNGIYSRIYMIDWSPFYGVHGDAAQRGEIRKGRFSTVIEALSYNSLYNTEAPVQTHYWGVPFIIE